MPWLVHAGIAVVVLCCAVATAGASCPIELEGDPALAGRITAELAQFADDGLPCLALRVVCGAEGGGLTLELHDELGGSALRTFESATGAAAFLVSWSRRPLLVSPPATQPDAISGVHAPVRPSVATAAVQVQAPVAEVNASAHQALPRTTQLELHLAYLRVPDSSDDFVTLWGALIRHRGIWRYGANVRLTGTPGGPYDYINNGNERVRGWFGTDAAATFGVEGTADHFMARAELEAGATYVLALSQSGQLSSQAIGLHTGVRAGFRDRLSSRLWFEASAGWDVLLQKPFVADGPFGTNAFFQEPHYEVGLLWLL